MFPANLSLIGTTDPELDFIHLDLDEKLKSIGVPDDKKYFNPRFFFANMTLVRFTGSLTKQYLDKIQGISESLELDPYEVDSVTLLTCNAVLEKRQIVGSWNLK